MKAITGGMMDRNTLTDCAIAAFTHHSPSPVLPTVRSPRGRRRRYNPSSQTSMVSQEALSNHPRDNPSSVSTARCEWVSPSR